jgi:hypothetical protein
METVWLAVIFFACTGIVINQRFERQKKVQRAHPLRR